MSTTLLKYFNVMDRDEAKERCCSRCLRCFDEYDHYKHLKFIPIDQPKRDDVRYYCNKTFKYVMPNSIRPCFEER